MKFLYYPVRPFHINQGFGANRPCVKNFNTPAQQVILGIDNETCPVGSEKLYPLLGLPKGHNGLDLLSGVQKCFASHDGTITETQTERERGLGVAITSDETQDFFGLQCKYKTRYWHFDRILVQLGQKVKAGDLIGYTDSTGYSSGDHLHFELAPLNPDGSNTFQNNGFYGKIDPYPYFNGIYADKLKTEFVRLLEELYSVLKRRMK